MYQKSIDLLHTLYCCGGSRRQPSSADLPMTDGYGNSLGATLSLHPDAPVKSSISEVTHRLTDIFFTCRRAGIRPGLYGTALIDLAPIARRYGISIERSAFAEREGSVINNHGVIATGTHIAVAQGPGAHATVAGPAAVSIDQVFDLLKGSADQLSRSESPDVTELAQVVGEMGQEVARRPRARRGWRFWHRAWPRPSAAWVHQRLWRSGSSRPFTACESSTKPSRATGLDQIAHASREYIFCAPISYTSNADFDSVQIGGYRVPTPVLPLPPVLSVCAAGGRRSAEISASRRPWTARRLP